VHNSTKSSSALRVPPPIPKPASGPPLDQVTTAVLDVVSPRLRLLPHDLQDKARRELRRLIETGIEEGLAKLLETTSLDPATTAGIKNAGHAGFLLE
jgi:hypothetical protein